MLQPKNIGRRIIEAQHKDATSSHPLKIVESLGNVLNDEVIERGFCLLTKKRQDQISLLQLLGVETDYSRGRLQIVQAIANAGTLTSFCGETVNHMANLALTDAVDILQAEFFDTKQVDSYEKKVLSTARLATSQVVLSSSALDIKNITTETPVCSVGVTYNMSPSLFDMYDDGADVLPAIIDNNRNSINWRRPSAALAERVSARNEDFFMPDATYSLAFGKPAVTHGILNSICGVRAPNLYILQDDVFINPSELPEYDRDKFERFI